MNRNEKIRTYNFSRHMVTDHRLGSSVTVKSLKIEHDQYQRLTLDFRIRLEEYPTGCRASKDFRFWRTLELN